MFLDLLLPQIYYDTWVQIQNGTLTTSQLPKLRPVCLSLAVGAARRLTIAVFFKSYYGISKVASKHDSPTEPIHPSIACSLCRKAKIAGKDGTDHQTQLMIPGTQRAAVISGRKLWGKYFSLAINSYKASVSEVNTVLGLPTFYKTQDPVPQLLFCSSSNYSFII